MNTALVRRASSTGNGKVRFAVIGAGWISQIAFLPALAQSPLAELAVIVSGDAAKAQQLVDFYGQGSVCRYDDFDDLARSGRIDAVYVATPNDSHASWAIRAAHHGLHVMVEKPLARDLAESRAMVQAARDAGVFLSTAYRMHHDPATVQLIQALRDGVIGQARACFATLAFQIDAGNHRLQAAHWGGPLQDVGVYCVNAARHVFGAEPLSVSASSGKGQGDARFDQVDADFSGTLQFSQGRTAQFFCSFGTDPLDVLLVQGTTGSLALRGAFWPFSARTLIVRREGQEERNEFPGGNEFCGMVSYFSQCILSGQAPAVDATEGLADMQVLLALEAAAAQGQPVRLAPTRTFTPLQADMATYFPPNAHKLMLG